MSAANISADLSPGDAIGAWEPARAQSLRRARRRSHLVSFLRRLFVAVAGAAFASVFVFMGLFAIQGGFSRNLYETTGQQRMVNPRFYGHTTSTGPYVITAESALRVGDADGTIDLLSPVYRTEAGAILVAPNGVYSEASQQFVLKGEVLFRDPSGNRFTTEDLTVDLSTGQVTGARGITGAGPLGVVEAASYELRESDHALVLSGGVRGQIPEKGGD